MDVEQLIVERLMALQREKVADLHRRLQLVLAQMDDESLYWRPHDQCNSVANLVAHLEGNLRQRFVAGIGAAADIRDREAEFDRQQKAPRAEVMRQVDESFGWVYDYLQRVTPAELLHVYEIQGLRMSVQEVIFGVVAHVSEHVGQIIYIAKLRANGTFDPLWKPRGRSQ